MKYYILFSLLIISACAKKQVISLDDGVSDHDATPIIIAPPASSMTESEDRMPITEPITKPSPRPTPNDRGS